MSEIVVDIHVNLPPWRRALVVAALLLGWETVALWLVERATVVKVRA